MSRIDFCAYIWTNKRTLLNHFIYKSSVVAEMGDRLATIDMGQKLGAWPFGGAAPHLIQCRLAEAYISTNSWSIHPSGHNRHGPKIGGCAPLSFRGELGLHLTQFSPGRGLPRHQVVSWCIQHRLYVRWDPSPPKKGGTSPNFRPMSVVAKWLNWSRCHIVLDGDPAAHPQRGTAPNFQPHPIFWPMSVMAKWLVGSRCHWVRR